MSSACAATAAEASAQGKIDKYEEISRRYLFFPIAIETLGPINRDGQDFLSELGRCISAITCDPRETSFYTNVFLLLFNVSMMSASQIRSATNLLTQVTQPMHT